MEKSRKFILSCDPDSRELLRREVGREGRILRELDERSMLCELPPDFESLFCQHRFPVQAISQGSPAELVPALEWPESARFAIQLSSNRRLDVPFGELVERWVGALGLNPERRDNRTPRWVLSGHFQAEDEGVTLYAGSSPVEENLSPWSRGICRIPRDSEAVSRAESKLEEALEILGMHGFTPAEKGAPALDLGAAPGGWSRVLARLGYSVHAVDPASLEPGVEKLSGVTYHQTTAHQFLQSDSSKYRMIVCDMKMEAGRAAELMVETADRLSDGGAVVLTLKLPKGPAALHSARDALEKTRRAYTVVQARQLYFNRREVTVIATPAPG